MDFKLNYISASTEREAYRIAVNIDRLLNYKYDLTTTYKYQDVWYVQVDKRISNRDRWAVLDLIKKLGVQ